MIILPSLEIVPAKYNTSTNTLLSQIPIDGTGDFTVTRATSPTTGRSTRVNALGQIELVADNVPRLDYPIGGGCPALLVEPSAQNFVPSGTVFNSSTGINYDNVPISLAVGISGTVISKTNTAAGTQYANQNCLTALPSGSTNYTISRFFKYNGTDIVTSLEFNNGNNWGNVPWRQFINITSTEVTLGVSFFCTGSVENYGDGWYRVAVKLTTGTTPTLGPSVQYLMAVPGTVASGGSFLTALPQLEVGLVATSYINTTAGSITRAADVIRKTNIASLIGQSEGTVYFEVEVTAEARDKWIFSLDSAANSFIQGYITVARVLGVSISNAGGTVMTALNSSALSVGYHKVAFAYNTATNGCQMFIDGVQNPVASRTITGAGMPPLNNFTFGSYISTQSDTLKGHVRAGSLYPTRLTDTQLALLTSPYTSYSSMASALSYTLG